MWKTPEEAEEQRLQMQTQATAGATSGPVDRAEAIRRKIAGESPVNAPSWEKRRLETMRRIFE